MKQYQVFCTLDGKPSPLGPVFEVLSDAEHEMFLWEQQSKRSNGTMLALHVRQREISEWEPLR